MDSAIRLIEAIAKLITAFAWPAAIVVGVWLVVGKQREAVRRAIGRITKLGFPGGEIELAEQVEERRENIEQTAEELRDLILSSQEIAAQVEKSLIEIHGAVDQGSKDAEIERILNDLLAATQRRDERINKLISGLVGDAEQMSVLAGAARRPAEDDALSVLADLVVFGLNPLQFKLRRLRTELHATKAICEDLRKVIHDPRLGALLLAEGQNASPDLLRRLRQVRDGDLHGGRRLREAITDRGMREELHQIIWNTYRMSQFGPPSGTTRD